MEVALFIHFSLGSSMKPSSFFLVPPWLWTPGHPQITVKISPLRVSALGFTASWRAVTQGVWLCGSAVSVEASCPMRTHPSRKNTMGRFDHPRQSQYNMFFFTNILFFSKKSHYDGIWWLLPRENWWYTMESQRSICHMPYPSFRLHTEQRKSYDKNHSWVFANISTLIIALRPLLKYDMHREIRKDIDCSRLRVYASWFLNG